MGQSWNCDSRKSGRYGAKRSYCSVPCDLCTWKTGLLDGRNWGPSIASIVFLEKAIMIKSKSFDFGYEREAFSDLQFAANLRNIGHLKFGGFHERSLCMLGALPKFVKVFNNYS